MIKEGFKIALSIGVGFGILFCFSFFIKGNDIRPVSNQALVISTVQKKSETTPANLYTVVRVIDGDTVVVDMNGKNVTVRLIGINTPETVDPRKKVECFGKEASEFLKNILTGKQVRLESDSTQRNIDKYGRLLRYVYLNDILVNEEIISSGYGFEYTYDVPYEFQAEFMSSESYARAGKLGLWSPVTCNGEVKTVGT